MCYCVSIHLCLASVSAHAIEMYLFIITMLFQGALQNIKSMSSYIFYIVGNQIVLLFYSSYVLRCIVIRAHLRMTPHSPSEDEGFRLLVDLNPQFLVSF